MNSTGSSARLAGLLYFVMSVLSVLSFVYFGPRFVVAGDAAATARRITEGEPVYRLGILVGFLALISFIFLAWTLYDLFKDVDRNQARLMLILATVGITIALVNLIIGFAPLILLSGAGFLSAFTKPQLEALAFGFLRLKGSGSLVPSAFWGLWLFPFGILVIKSGFLPRILGVLLLFAGFAYPAVSFASIALPAHAHLVSRLMMPLQFGELPIVIWLLVVGARVRPPGAQPSPVM